MKRTDFAELSGIVDRLTIMARRAQTQTSREFYLSVKIVIERLRAEIDRLEDRGNMADD